jgi:hypothetical protein
LLGARSPTRCGSTAIEVSRAECCTGSGERFERGRPVSYIFLDPYRFAPSGCAYERRATQVLLDAFEAETHGGLDARAFAAYLRKVLP